MAFDGLSEIVLGKLFHLFMLTQLCAAVNYKVDPLNGLSPVVFLRRPGGMQKRPAMGRMIADNCRNLFIKQQEKTYFL